MIILEYGLLNVESSFFDTQFLPTVTIAIPAKNESETIESVIQYFLSLAYPNILGRVLKVSQSPILSYEGSRLPGGFKTDPRNTRCR